MRTVITAKSVSGTKEWSKFSVNCCTGCEHNCRYCYARHDALHRYGGRIKSAEEWATPRIRDKDVRKGRKKLDGRIMFPTTHDITPANVEACLTVLGKLLAAGNEVLVVSKPHLDCMKELCSRFGQFTKQIVFRFTIGADDDSVLKYWEPGAPPFAERLACIKWAFEHGFQTSVSVEPMLDSPNIARLFRRLSPFVTDSIWIGKVNKIRQRVEIKTAMDEAIVRRTEEGQTDQAILAIYEALKSEPKVRWKESIGKVVGILRPSANGKLAGTGLGVRTARNAMGRRKPLIGIMEVTPQTARHWLSVTRRCRIRQDLDAATRAAEVFAGQGAARTDVVVISKDGIVIAGLHKLKACAQAEAESTSAMCAVAPDGGLFLLPPINGRKPRPTAGRQQGAKSRAGRAART